jgi:hypothetical protein
MATHDYVIANQGFPSFRSDLNDALAAIVSNNSSATAPSTTFAHMIWVDTDADPSVVKMRNADNDAWITLFQLDQTGDLSNIAVKNVAQTFTAQQTFQEVKDTVYTITDDAGFEIDPANGSIQVVTLGANRTPAATNFEAGQVVLLGIDDGTDYTVTWSTVGVTWVKVGGTATAPTLATSGYTWVLLWKVSTTIYGVEVGSP